MKKQNLSKLLIGFITIVMFSCVDKKENQNLNFFRNSKKEIKPAFQLLPLGSVMPGGWLKDQINDQAESGFCQYLDELSPMIMKDQIWGKQRRSAARPNERNLPDIGIDSRDLQWWNGESQGNWFDGLFRTAILSQNKKAMEKVDSLVRYLISTQDPDGYFGVYDSTLRFKNFEGNGELWTQAAALRAMLAYYQYTNDNSILHFVERAVKRTMLDFNEKSKNPFDIKNTGGVPHGLMFADITEELYRYTQDTIYRNYTVWLYNAFSVAEPEDNDIHFSFLVDSSKNFIGHSAHTFEHLRVLLYAYYFSGYPELQKAVRNFYFKTDKVILPSGVPFGFENLWGLHAHPDSTAAEYCNMVEYEISLIRALQFSADNKFGDKIEKAFFNGMQGARFPDNKAITYDQTDNSYILNTHNPCYVKGAGLGYSEFESRYKFSPTQEDVAVCCVPNACKSYPYYISNMWMKSDDGLAATLYGPCTLSTEVNGKKVMIEEKTNYPFSEAIELIIHSDTENEFNIYLRIPEWSVNSTVKSAGAKIEKKDGYFVISNNWNKGDKINISFESKLLTQTANDQSVYFQKGPLVYAYNIPANDKIIKEYSIPGFYDYHHTAKNEEYKSIRLTSSGDLSFIQSSGPIKNPWAKSPVALKGKVQIGTEQKEIELVPMGCTILRRVTFKAQ